MADLTYAQARALIASDLLTAFAMLLSGNRPDGTVIEAPGSRPGTSSPSVAIVLNGAASLILAANTNRDVASFINTGTVTIWIDTVPGVTTDTGIPVDVGDDFADYLTGDAWYAVTGGSAGEVRVKEVTRP